MVDPNAFLKAVLRTHTSAAAGAAGDGSADSSPPPPPPPAGEDDRDAGDRQSSKYGHRDDREPGSKYGRRDNRNERVIDNYREDRVIDNYREDRVVDNYREDRASYGHRDDRRRRRDRSPPPARRRHRSSSRSISRERYGTRDERRSRGGDDRRDRRKRQRRRADRSRSYSRSRSREPPVDAAVEGATTDATVTAADAAVSPPVARREGRHRSRTRSRSRSRSYDRSRGRTGRHSRRRRSYSRTRSRSRSRSRSRTRASPARAVPPTFGAKVSSKVLAAIGPGAVISSLPPAPPAIAAIGSSSLPPPPPAIAALSRVATQSTMMMASASPTPPSAAPVTAGPGVNALREAASGGDRHGSSYSRPSTYRSTAGPARRLAQRRRSRSPMPTIPHVIDLEKEMERLNRTVGVLQLSGRLRSRELQDVFEQLAGDVVEAIIVKDHRTGVSKGLGYVEFKNAESVAKALAASGTEIMGVPCIVQTTDTEKRLLQEQAAANGGNLDLIGTAPPKFSTGGPQSGSDLATRRLYAGNLHPNLMDEDLRSVFEPFGAVETVRIHRDASTGQSKGYGFVQFTNPEDAKRAINEMTNFLLVGKKLRLGWVHDKTVAQIITDTDALAASGGGAGQLTTGPRTSGGDMQMTTGGGGPTTGGGVTIGDELEEGSRMHVSRVEMMKRLVRAEDNLGPTQNQQAAATVLPGTFPPAAVASVPTVAPTRNCVLKNMFDPKQETEPNWQDDIKADVMDECSQFGRILAADVDKHHPEGHVYLRFETVPACEAAVRALNGRWFAKKQIVAQFVVDAIFDARV